MPIWLLGLLGLGGYLLVTEVLAKPEVERPPEPRPLLTPLAAALHKQTNAVYGMWRTGSIDDERLGVEIDAIGAESVRLREGNVISASEHELLRKQRVAILAEAGLI